MKRVLHITYDMGIGGTEQVINQLIRGIDKTAVEHRICCIEGGVGAIGLALQQQGVAIDILSRQPGFDWALIKGIRKLIKSHRIDIVHCHQYTPWVYGWFAALGTKARVIFTEHGRFYPDRHRYKAWLLNKLMAATTYKITAISKATAAALVQYEFIPADKIDVVYNGIESLISAADSREKARQELGIQPEQRIIGTVARLDPIKNQTLLINAFAELTKEFPDLVLLIVGDGPERDNLEQLANSLGIKNNVIFAGFKSPPTDYMALIALFLLPSLSEGTSMTLLEAMSLGIPCLVSDVGGNPEVIHRPELGDVFPLSTPHALAAIIQRWLIKNFVPEGKLQRQQIFQQTFSVEVMSQHYLRYYQMANGPQET